MVELAQSVLTQYANSGDRDFRSMYESVRIGGVLLHSQRTCYTEICQYKSKISVQVTEIGQVKREKGQKDLP